jgi:hypothetical protein
MKAQELMNQCNSSCGIHEIQLVLKKLTEARLSDLLARKKFLDFLGHSKTT